MFNLTKLKKKEKKRGKLPKNVKLRMASKTVENAGNLLMTLGKACRRFNCCWVVTPSNAIMKIFPKDSKLSAA